MKTILKPSVPLLVISGLLAGCATALACHVAREYRVVHGVADASGIAGLEEQLNAAGREGFTIHSTTMLPREEGRRQTVLIVLERPAPGGRCYLDSKVSDDRRAEAIGGARRTTPPTSSRMRSGTWRGGSSEPAPGAVRLLQFQLVLRRELRERRVRFVLVPESHRGDVVPQRLVASA